jgi:hypothetical protein
MAHDIIRFVGRRRRILEHLDWATEHASVPMWEHDPARRDAISFRLILAAKLARDVACPPDLLVEDCLWIRGLVRFGSVNQPEQAEFLRVVERELPPVRARIAASIDSEPVV